MSLQDWYIPMIIGLLPVLMHTTLGLFLLGLAIFLIPQSVETGGVMSVILLVGFSAYASTNLLPLAYPHCPYRTPLSGFFNFLGQVCSVYHCVTFPVFPTFFPCADVAQPRVRATSLKDAERMAVHDMGDLPDVRAVSWLHSMSSNPAVQSIAVQSTSSLPLESTSLMEQEEGIVGSLRERIGDCIDIRTGVRIGMEKDLERYLRASIHLGLSAHSGVMNPLFTIARRGLAKEKSPSIRAAFLAVLRYPGSNDVNAIPYLLKSMSSDLEQEQPVIWAHMLCNILTQSDPLHGESAVILYRHFLNAFPKTYWSFTWVEPAIGFRTPAMYSEGACPDIEICSTECDAQVSLASAISSCLYPLLGKLLLYHFSPSAETEAGGEPGSSPEWSDVPIPLQLLLSMLRSPHIEDAGLLHEVLVHLELYVTTLKELEAQVWKPDKTRTCRTIIRHLHSITQYAINAGSHIAWSQMNQRFLWETFVDAISTLPSLGDPDLVEESSRWWTSADNKLIDFVFTGDPSEPIHMYRLLAKTFQLPVLPSKIFIKIVDEHLFDDMCTDVLIYPHYIYQFMPLFQGYLDHLTTSTSLGSYSSDILQRATNELFRPRNLIITFKVLAKTKDIQCLKGIGRLRPDAPAWEVLFATFDNRTSDVAFWEPSVDSNRDPATYNAILLEFRQNWKSERQVLN